MQRQTTWLLILTGVVLVGIIGLCIFGAGGAGASPLPPPMQFLMVDQHGQIVPAGYTAGLTEIATVAAQAEMTRQAAQVVHQSALAASNVVNDVVAALTGAFGFAYVSGHVVSFAGGVTVSPEATALIVHCEFGAGGTTTIDDVQHTGHFIWHAYSEAMNTIPAVKYRSTLHGEPVWTFAPQQSTAQFKNHTLRGIFYPVVYRTTVWLPSSLDGAFFMAFCEILPGGQAGGMFEVREGISINGKVGFTGSVNRNGLVWAYQTGLLISVLPEGK